MTQLSANNPVPPPSSTPTLEFKGITLDPFQVEAVNALGQGHHCVVSAPTGSGKTLIAEYLIHQALPRKRRIVYTSPLKALSNQKYREFSRSFPGMVGIITGDVSINRDAPLVIMTTEIYRNMVLETHRVSDQLLFDIIIFDEVHFIADRDRGTVWEEAIIFSPKKIQILGLSATISNADEIAGWLHSVTGTPCSVVLESRRPVPLYHMLHTSKTGLKPAAYISNLPLKLQESMQEKKPPLKGFKIIEELQEKDLLPVLFFLFSRDKTLELANLLSENFDFLKDFPDKKRQVLEKFDALCEKFNLKDLDSAGSLRRIIQKGIGIHHAGLIPQFKEIIEQLFDAKLIQVLFVTETFAMGINMPAKTVVFHMLKKFDGITTRPLSPGEYMQLSGRAGRRGIDPKGTVVVNFDTTLFDPKDYLKLIHGDPDPIKSRFTLSFNTILNIYMKFTAEEIPVILKQNFAQFSNNRRIGDFSREISQLQEDRATLQLLCDRGDMPALYTAKTILRENKTLLRTLYRSLKRYHKQHEKARFQEDILRLQNAMDEARDKIYAGICGSCKDNNTCWPIYEQMVKLDGKVTQKGDYLERQKELLIPQYQHKLGLLESLGYVENGKISARGLFAAKIHTQEIYVTELVFDGFFNQSNQHLICGMLASLIYEGKPNLIFPHPPKKHPVNSLHRYKKRFTNDLAKMGQNFDIKVAYMVYLWSENLGLTELMNCSSLPEGDFIKLIRQTIDMAQQISVAVDDPFVRQKLKQCVKNINRDLVLAIENSLDEESSPPPIPADEPAAV